VLQWYDNIENNEVVECSVLHQHMDDGGQMTMGAVDAIPAAAIASMPGMESGPIRVLNPGVSRLEIYHTR